MKEIIKKVQSIYNRVADFIGETSEESQLVLINAVYDELVDIPDFNELVGRCAFHINGWNDELTIAERIDEGYEILEDVCGTLGEWLDENN